MAVSKVTLCSYDTKRCALLTQKTKHKRAFIYKELIENNFFHILCVFFLDVRIDL